MTRLPLGVWGLALPRSARPPRHILERDYSVGSLTARVSPSHDPLTPDPRDPANPPTVLRFCQHRTVSLSDGLWFCGTVCGSCLGRSPAPSPRIPIPASWEAPKAEGVTLGLYNPL